MQSYTEYDRGVAVLRKSNNKFVKELVINTKCTMIFLYSEEFESFYEGIGEGNYKLHYNLYKDVVGKSFNITYNVEISLVGGLKIVKHSPDIKRTRKFVFLIPIIDDDDLLDLLFTA